MAHPANATPSGTTSLGEDERDWDGRADTDAGASEALLATAVSEGDNPSGRHRSSAERPKAWAERGGRTSVVDDDYGGHDGEGGSEGSEDELLLDPNLPEGYAHRMHTLPRHSTNLDDDDPLKHATAAEEEDSPYPEVRAAVRNYDEDVPCNTVRAWTIGLLLIFLGASMNTLFSLRSPSISLGALIAQVIAWPMGHGWSRVMPDRHFETFGFRWSLNPGPFNIKEHAIIVVMANVSFSVAYATDIILAQAVFYKQDFGLLFQLMLTISTQSLGYGIAGMMRKFLGGF